MQMPDVIECNSINNLKPKMTRPEILSLDLEEDMDSLKDRVAQFDIECTDYFNFYKIPRSQWTQHAFHWITGRLKRIYARKYAKAGNVHLSWLEFTELLEELTQSTDTPQHHLRSSLVKFSMEHECVSKTGELKSLAYGIWKLEDVANKIRGLDEEARCHALWNSLPERMKDDLQSIYDSQEGGNDYKALRKACLQRQEIFRRIVEQRRYLKRGRDPPPVQPPPPPRGFPSVNAMAVPAISSPTPPSKSTWGQTSKLPPRGSFIEYKVNANDVPQADRYKDFKAGRIPCVVAAEEELASRRQARKCLLCGGSNHYLRACTDREKKFRDGLFFYCPTQYGQKIE